LPLFASIIGKKISPLVLFLDEVKSIYRIPIPPDHPIEASLSLFSFEKYHRIKILFDQDNYLDVCLRVLRDIDPSKTALVFSCGVGAVRTTFAMAAASLVRRKQMLANGVTDPYASKPPDGMVFWTPAIGTVRIGNLGY